MLSSSESEGVGGCAKSESVRDSFLFRIRELRSSFRRASRTHPVRLQNGIVPIFDDSSPLQDQDPWMLRTAPSDETVFHGHTCRKFCISPVCRFKGSVHLERRIPRYLVVSPVSNSDLEVCRFPISAKVGAYSCRTTLRRELLTWISPLYSMKPSFLNLFMKKLTQDRVMPIISASISCDILGITF